MVEAAVLEKRLKFLEEQLVFLRTFKDIPEKEILSDKRNLFSAQLSLVYAIECLLDMGAHLVAARGWGSCDSYAEIARNLHQNGFLSEAKMETLAGMAGFRNVIVHGYLEVNREILIEVLHRRIDELQEIAEEFAALI